MSTDPAPPTDCDAPRRGRILALLEQAGDWCSGEGISAKLGISRAAVAKHVAALRAAGHGIESAPRRGYRLAVKTDRLSWEDMKRRLTTRVFGQKEWRCLEETTSTNKIAALWAVEGAEEGCLVLTERQSAGRGKKGSAWYSPPRALQFSVVLQPAFHNNITEVLTMLGTVAVAEAVLRVCPLKPVIKAPNDVLINKRKICGVLVEVGLSAGDAAWAVLGIGCNVNAQYSDFPDSLKSRASSLFVEGGIPLSRMDLLAVMLERLEFWYGYIQRGNPAALQSRRQELQCDHPSLSGVPKQR